MYRHVDFGRAGCWLKVQRSDLALLGSRFDQAPSRYVAVGAPSAAGSGEAIGTRG